jgi:type 1 fimbriae regulatory protein FimB
MFVHRLKSGVSTTHPLYNGEIKAIKDWMAKRKELTTESSGTLFISEQRKPFSRSIGHSNIQHTTKYAALSPNRFANYY